MLKTERKLQTLVMEKQEWDEGKGLHFPSFREDEISTENLSPEGREASLSVGTLSISCLLREN